MHHRRIFFQCRVQLFIQCCIGSRPQSSRRIAFVNSKVTHQSHSIVSCPIAISWDCLPIIRAFILTADGIRRELRRSPEQFMVWPHGWTKLAHREIASPREHHQPRVCALQLVKDSLSHWTRVPNITPKIWIVAFVRPVQVTAWSSLCPQREVRRTIFNRAVSMKGRLLADGPRVVCLRMDPGRLRMSKSRLRTASRLSNRPTRGSRHPVGSKSWSGRGHDLKDSDLTMESVLWLYRRRWHKPALPYLPEQESACTGWWVGARACTQHCCFQNSLLRCQVLLCRTLTEAGLPWVCSSKANVTPVPVLHPFHRYWPHSYDYNTPSTSPRLPRSWLIVYVPCKIRMTKHLLRFADTQGFTYSGPENWRVSEVPDIFLGWRSQVACTDVMQLLRLIRPRFCRVKEFLRTAPPRWLCIAMAFRGSSFFTKGIPSVAQNSLLAMPGSWHVSYFPLPMVLVNSRNQWQSRACLNIFVFLFLSFFCLKKETPAQNRVCSLERRGAPHALH